MGSPFKHLLGTFQVVAQIAQRGRPDLFGMVASAMLAVGVRPEVKDSGLSNVAAAPEQGVKRLATVRSAREQMHPARWTIDVFVTNDATLHPDEPDFLFDQVVNSVVIARQDCMTASLRIC